MKFEHFIGMLSALMLSTIVINTASSTAAGITSVVINVALALAVYWTSR